VRTKSLLAAAVAVTAATATALLGGPAAASPVSPVGAGRPIGVAGGPTANYVVLAADGVPMPAAIQAVTGLGGRVTASNPDIGTLTVTAPATGFIAAASRSKALAGVTSDRVIGRLPADRVSKPDVNAEPRAAARAAAVKARATGVTAPTTARPRAVGPAPAATEPLADLQWDMKMIKADQAAKTNKGDPRVLVGIIDSGIDTSNPDLAAVTDLDLSRNFVTDLPAIDGPCEFAGCVDPVGHDDDGHGTHVAGTVAAAANGIGISGVAPNVTLVEVRGGQDSGFLFLNPVINALTYSADIGIDVVNMSFFVDPWLFNCQNNPADSPDEQAEQRAITTAMVRALNYAHRHNVTLVAAEGNDHQDLGNPLPDRTSPDFPAGTAKTRTIDNATCLSLPIEGPNVIGVSALGPSLRKADYSNYGQERTTVAAPGGFFRDGFGTPTFRTAGNEVLSTYPEATLQAAGEVDAAGNVVPGFEGTVFKSCASDGRTCGYYTYLQGTSMASPHAAGVAALIVSRYGKADPNHPGGVTFSPDRVRDIITTSATKVPCAVPVERYANEGRGPEFDAPCTGTMSFNSIYGHGVVDTLAVVAGPRL
jgi:subtilisin family serine protease